MSITFVTAFVDIGRKTEAELQKFENYFEWIQTLLKLPLNIYFFTTKELHDQLKYEPRSNLKFVIIDTIPFFDRLPEVRKLLATHITNNAKKDTPEFACLMHGKFQLVKRAINDNPFNSTHYGWIDAGILKIATNGERLPSLPLPEKVKVVMINYTGKEEIKDPTFAMTCRYKIAGGFFLGPKDHMETFMNRMIEAADLAIKDGKFGFDQEYMAIVYRQDPSIFDPYYGDYSDQIINYDKCERNDWLPRRVLYDAIAHGDEEERQRVAAYLTKSGLTY